VTGYVALLRGINVGRGVRIGMGQLRAVANGLGWSDVNTYLQSGNLVFTIPARLPSPDLRQLGDQLTAAVADTLGVRPAVLVLHRATLTALVEGNPFPDQAAAAPRTVHAIVLAEDAGEQTLARVATATERAVQRGSPDIARVVGRAVWLHTPDGMGRSELAGALTRHGGLGRDSHGGVVVATARNAATLHALVTLGQAG